ncbi:MAG: hypothetical protein ACSHWZ_07030 [Sulfitobacter sp.]
MASKDTTPSNIEWTEAKGLMPTAAPSQTGPQGALVPDHQHDRDRIAVVYNKGETPPEITIKTVSGSVHTVMANGIAVAVVASSREAAPTVSDVILVERSVYPGA